MTREILDNPVTGERFCIVEQAGDVESAPLVVEYTALPRTPRLEHIHPHIEEEITVLEGRAVFTTRDSRARVLRPADTVVVPPGMPHSLVAFGDDALLTRCTFTPGLRIASLFHTITALARDGRTNHRGDPGFMQAIVLGDAYRREFATVQPPRAVQLLAFALLAPLARLGGYRATYDADGGMTS
jgi:mannose-6-phosphate isomerase-like protein (cupin superfamily)